MGVPYYSNGQTGTSHCHTARLAGKLNCFCPLSPKVENPKPPKPSVPEGTGDGGRAGTGTWGFEKFKMH